MSWHPEVVAEPGWFAVRLRPGWAERRRRIRPVGQLKGKQLEPRAIAAVNRAAGFTDPALLATSVCVVLAESDGYTEAVNENTDGTTDRGIWQLNSSHTSISDAAAYDPARAAVAAHGLWKAAGGSFQPWVAWDTGVCFDDGYVFRALLGVLNLAAETLQADQQARPARAGFHSLPVPVVSFAQMRRLYPHVPGL